MYSTVTAAMRLLTATNDTRISCATSSKDIHDTRDNNTKRCVQAVYVVVDGATWVSSLRRHNVPECIGSVCIRIYNIRQPDA